MTCLIWSQKTKQSGLSLVELLITLLLLAVLVISSTSAFSGLIPRHRALSAMSTFKGLFQFARTTAVYTQRTVTVCALTVDNKCTRDWSGDRTIAVFVDNNRNRYLDEGDEGLRQLDWPARKGTILWRASLARTYIDFLPMGNTWQNGTLYYCPVNGDNRHANALVLSHSGRSYFPGDSDGNGIREDRKLKDLSC